MAVDDLVEEIIKTLGDETRLSDWLTVDQNMIQGFADVTKDHQWIHSKKMGRQQLKNALFN